MDDDLELLDRVAGRDLALAQLGALEDRLLLGVGAELLEIGDRADPVAEGLAGRQHVLQFGVVVEAWPSPMSTASIWPGPRAPFSRTVMSSVGTMPASEPAITSPSPVTT